MRMILEFEMPDELFDDRQQFTVNDAVIYISKIVDELKLDDTVQKYHSIARIGYGAENNFSLVSSNGYVV